MKKCPRCSNELKEIKIKGIYGQEISVDMCPLGCGIWFDKDEIFKSKLEEVEKIDTFNEIFIIPQKENINCPVCNIKMAKYRNPSYKIDFDLDYCQKCYGFWFDRGEAIKFKNLYQEKIKKLKEETKITLKPSVENFEKIALEEEEADNYLKIIYSLLRFFLPF